MKKLSIFLGFLILCVSSFAQPMFGPNYKGDFKVYPKDPLLVDSLTFQAPIFKWEGTLEFHHGLYFMRINDQLFYLILPKKEGLTIDTVSGKGPKVEVWGYRYLSPTNQIIVQYMMIDGKATFDYTPMTILR